MRLGTKLGVELGMKMEKSIENTEPKYYLTQIYWLNNSIGIKFIILVSY